MLEPLSFDAIRAAVQAQLDAKNCSQPTGAACPWIRDLYPDRAIVDWDGKLYQVPYVVDGSDVSIGEMTEVVQEYILAKAPQGQKSLAFLGEIGRAGDLYRVEVLRTGAWDYPGMNDGGFEITDTVLSELEENFDKGLKGYEVCLNREHEEDKPCGWVKGLKRSSDGAHLYALFEITDTGTKTLVDDGSLKYCSSELNFAWVDPEACRTCGDCAERKVFEGLALTNTPYIKRMEPIQRVVSLSAFAKKSGARCSDSACGANPHKRNKEATMPVTTLEEANTQIATLQAKLAEAQASGGSAAKLSELELKLSEAEQARKKDLARLREMESRIELDRAKDRLMTCVRKGKLTRPVFAQAMRLCEVLIRGGAKTIQLSEKVSVTKVRLAEGEAPGTEELDKLDVVSEVLDMLQELPDAIATNPDDLVLDEDGPARGDDDDDELDKAAKAEMAEAKKRGDKITYRQAVVLADKKRREVTR